MKASQRMRSQPTAMPGALVRWPSQQLSTSTQTGRRLGERRRRAAPKATSAPVKYPMYGFAWNFNALARMLEGADADDVEDDYSEAEGELPQDVLFAGFGALEWDLARRSFVGHGAVERGSSKRWRVAQNVRCRRMQSLVVCFLDNIRGVVLSFFVLEWSCVPLK